MRRTKQEAAETRHTILKAAETLFLEKGYDSVSLDEVATAAGTSRGAIHWHFRNKQGLLFALRDELRLPMQYLVDRLSIDTTLVALAAPGDALEEAFVRFQNDPRQKRMLRVILATEWAAEDALPQGGRLQDQTKELLFSIFQAAHKNKPLPAPWTPKSATIAFNAMVNGLVSDWARGAEDFELVPDVVAIVHTVLEAWGAPPARGQIKGPSVRE